MTDDRTAPKGAYQACAAGLDHLTALVQQHQRSHGVDEAPACIDACWEPAGWWLSIVMPGHYAYEREGASDLGILVAEAVAYYAEETGYKGGCQEQHPILCRHCGESIPDPDEHRFLGEWECHDRPSAKDDYPASGGAE